MGRDGGCSAGAKVYESKKEKKRRLAMISGAESEEFVIAPRAQIVQDGNDESGGRPGGALEKRGNGEMRVTRSGGLKRKLGSEEGSKGSGIVVDQSDSEEADSVGTGESSKNLVPQKIMCKIAGSAEGNVSESMPDKKRSIDEDDDGEISRKKTKADCIDIIVDHHQPDISGEGKSLNIVKDMDKGIDGAVEDVQVSKMPVSGDKDGDGERLSEEKFQPSLRTSGKPKAVRRVGRPRSRNPRNVKAAGFSDIGVKDEDNGGSSQGRYSRMHGKGGILRVLQSKKKVAVPSAAIGGKRKGIMRRSRSLETNKVGMKDRLLESKIDDKLISNIKRGKIAGKVSSEDTAKSSINQVTVSPMEGSQIVNLLHGMPVSAANNTENTKNSDTSRSGIKNKIRDHIKSIILDAGWKIECRPRKGRNYEDSIYVSPQGSGYWSITKAYDIYLRTAKIACNDKEGSEKEFNAPAEKDSNFKEANSTFAVIPPEVLHLLKRNVVNKRRGKKEMEEVKRKGGVGRKKKKVKDGIKVKGSKDKRMRGDIRGTRALKRKLLVKNSKRRGCALLVRGSNKGEGSEEGDYAPYLWKRTVLSWMIDLGLLPPYEKVSYMNKRRTRALMDGRITRDGIECSCCSKIFTVSKFEVHAGSKLHQPYENICMDVSGISLLQCQINAWEKQESVQRNFYDVDTEGDDPNDDTCGICADGGDLICCDSCPSTFHLGCLGIEMLPTGDWHCSNCSCKFCGSVHVSTFQDGNASDALFTCLQCAQKYHKGCVPKDDAVPNVSNSSSNIFCRRSCRKVFRNLQKLIGVRHELEAGFYWSIVRRFDDPSKSLSNMSQKVESNSKIAVAYAVMDECFVPIVDQRSGINLIHNVVYNCGANFNRLNFSGFYTFILERGDEIIAAASVRIHDIRLAEMPFIGTRSMYRRQGMCRRLLKGIESALHSLCIRRLIIPAISELTETWTTVFGFMPLDISQQEEVKSMNMLVFPGTGLLQKSLLKGSNKHPANPELENKPETQISVEEEKKCQIEEIIDSNESKCDADGIQPSVQNISSCTSVLQVVSGCHSQFCRSLDSAANLELHGLQNVSSCSNHIEKDVSSSNCSDEMAAFIEEPKKEIKDAMNTLPNFQHPPSELLHGPSGIEVSGSRPPEDVSTFESSVSDVYEDVNFAKKDDRTPDVLQASTSKPLSNGVTHEAILDKCELMQADEDISHEINVSKLKHGNDESNVKEAATEIFGYVGRHLSTSPGRSSYASSECYRNRCASNPKVSCVPSNESISQEKSELLQNQLKCYFAANDSAPLDQLLVSDSAKRLDIDGASGIAKTFSAYDSKLKELIPGVNQHFTSNTEIADDCHDDISDVNILEKQLGIVDMVLTNSSLCKH